MTRWTAYNETVAQDYDNQGLLNTLGSYITASDYNAAGQLESLTFGNTAATDYTYNSQNLRLTDLVTTKGSTLESLHYRYDNVGNILAITDTVRSETTSYGYDDLNRLLSASATGANPYSRSWTYDPIGDISQRTEGSTYTYTYDTTHKHAVKQVGSSYYCYDANGNMTQRNATKSGCTTGSYDVLTYDIENRMTSMTHSGTTTNLTYNGDGVRVKREVVGVGTTYYIGNYYEVYVPSGGGQSINKYYYFGTQRVAANIAGTLFYLQSDHLGSSTLVMTSSGTLNTRQTYYPFGAPRTTDGSALPTDYTFTGQKSDDSTGLMYYGARYYDTTLGRFTQPDTIVPSATNPQGLNRYTYTLNNPVRLVDPSGHAQTCEDSCGTPGSGNPSAPPPPNPPTTPPGTTTTPPPADNGGNQTSDDDGCWPNCHEHNRYDEQDQTNSAPAIQQVALGGGGGAYSNNWKFDYSSYNSPPGEAPVTETGGPAGGPGPTGGGGGIGNLGLGGLATYLAGRAGEIAAGIGDVVKEQIPSLTGTANWRWPDMIDDTTKTIMEVKNVAYQSWTWQLKDDAVWALSNDLNFVLKVRDTTILSKSVMKAEELGVVTVERFLAPK
jgi:RHS repeat-associated protein